MIERALSLLPAQSTLDVELIEPEPVGEALAIRTSSGRSSTTS